MLSKQQKEVASLYALHCISMEDVTYLLGIPQESIPQEFYDYAKKYSEEYNAYLDKLYSDYCDYMDTVRDAYYQ